MNEKLNQLIKIFTESVDVLEVKKYSKKIRKTQLPIYACFLYRFLYCLPNISKEKICAYINTHLNTSFARNSFESKENNISIKCYENLLNKLKTFYFNNISSSSNNKCAIVSIDGTYNNDYKHKEILNIGFFDSSNSIPINLISCENGSKNKEIFYATKYILSHLSEFNNKILVFDRFYSSFEFIDFLIKNKLKFIIRQRNNTVKSNFKKINEQLRFINFDHTYDKIIPSSSKKLTKTNTISVNDAYLFITNLDDTYDDNLIFNLYGQRWNIETFFGFIKANFKFQNMLEHDFISIKKMYLCELILYYLKQSFKNILNITHQINEKLFMEGITDNILFKLFDASLDYDTLDKLSKSYTHKTFNKKGRKFARISKKPFSKWYIKAYSDATKYKRIINAILNKEIYTLNKNEKLIAHKIINFK